uniref:Transcriptional coactivator p15 (PC4) C-terminal domain-containing protein n=1 Tax=Globisporangium ultimum (strain ATCC 200006 / CBS 805.95 / DAOM BR144) TaxID=431595 RepID=K3X067_GLOUD
MFASALQKRKAPPAQQQQQSFQQQQQQQTASSNGSQWKRTRQIAEEVDGASAAWSLSEMLSSSKAQPTPRTEPTTNAGTMTRGPAMTAPTACKWGQQKPVASARAAAGASKAVGKKPQQKGEEDQEGIVFELSAKRRVTVRKWRAAVLVDVREYYDDNGASKPGKKGISLSRDQWETLQRLSRAIDEAVELVKEDSVDEQSLADVDERVAVDSKERSIAFALSPKRRITVRFFRTAVLIDLREYYDQDGVSKPGKKGISLSKEQWRALQELRPEISDAIRQL